MKKIGLNLTGGGARGAYQAGVLLGLSEIMKELGLEGENNPIKIWSGNSAGAINSCFLAGHADCISEGAEKLVSLWKSLEPDSIYKTGIGSVSANSVRWVRDLTFGPLFKSKLAQYLLDTAPLYELLKGGLPLQRMGEMIETQLVDAVTCSSYNYNTSETITFLQSKESFQWDRRRRRIDNTVITPEHVLASCSIPLLFPPTALGNQYFGDGGFRNTAPLSPTIKLGAEKILMIGVKYLAPPEEIEGASGKPTVGHIAGSALNALFMDNLELDLERLIHLNEIIEVLGEGFATERSEYRRIDFKMIRPSQNISKIAEKRTEKGLPKMIQYLLSGLGTEQQSSDLASYILFESEFIGDLITLGQNDVINRHDEMKNWLLSD